MAGTNTGSAAYGARGKLIAKLKAPPVTNTSGGGFTFEDYFGAYLVAALTAGAGPLDPELGPPISIAFQTSADGWRLVLKPREDCPYPRKVQETPNQAADDS